MKWFRFYHEALHDAKVQTLSADLFKSWINILCLASEAEDRGALPSIPQIAFSLRIKEEKAKQIVDRLIKFRLIDEADDGSLSPHNWAERQPEADSSAERVRRYRDRIRDNGETITGYTKYRAEVFARDGRKCVYCAASKTLVLDHLVPVVRGGTGTPDNLVTACKACNSGKSGRLVEEAGYTFINPGTLAQYEAAKSLFGVTVTNSIASESNTSVSPHVTVTVTPVTSLDLEEIRLEEKREENTPPNPQGGEAWVSINGEEPIPVKDAPKPVEPEVDDAELARVGQRAERLFPMMGYGGKIRGIVGDYSLAEIDAGLTEFHASGKTNWPYMLGILRRIASEGIPSKSRPNSTAAIEPTETQEQVSARIAKATEGMKAYRAQLAQEGRHAPR